VRKTLLAFFPVFCFGIAAQALAEPVRLVSPLDSVETLQGHVDLRSLGKITLLTLSRPDGTVDRFFRVETSGQKELPGAFAADGAQILYWRGHLAVIAPREGKAIHFSIDGIEHVAAPVQRPVAVLPEPAAFDRSLRTRYELLRIEDATAIVSMGGPRAHRAAAEAMRSLSAEDDYQDPGSGVGVGSCGRSCSILCGDGSSCTTSCGSNRCASCSCPASCSCS
jgi:hypothetical protein